MVCWFETLGVPQVKSEHHTLRARRDWRKRKITPDWQVGVLIRKGTYMRLIWGSWKTNRSPYPPTRILKLYIEPLTWLSHLFTPHGLNNTLLSQGYVLETGPTAGTGGRMYIPRTGEAVWSLWFPGSRWRVSQRSHPRDDLLQLYSHILFWDLT